MKKVETEKLENVENDDVKVFRIAKQMRKKNKDIVGEKCTRDDSEKLAYSNEETKKLGSSNMKDYSCYSGDG